MSRHRIEISHKLMAIETNELINVYATGAPPCAAAKEAGANRLPTDPSKLKPVQPMHVHFAHICAP